MRLRVFLNHLGQRCLIGAIGEEGKRIVFQYAREFLERNLQLSPFAVPLSLAPWRDSKLLFDGLPGFVADTLPDGWGNFLLDHHLRKKGASLRSISPLERLAFVGNSGMGALEYEPADNVSEKVFKEIHADGVYLEVRKVLTEADSSSVDKLIPWSGSSGGARPKIVCLMSPNSDRLTKGVIGYKDFSPWIVKFRSSLDSEDIGVQEYICSLIAQKAGIDVSETRLLPSRLGPGWFAAKRFDRSSDGKVHMSTVAGLLHCDFRLPSLDYSTILTLTERLAGHRYLLEQLKRAVLNYLINNTDDHAKNFSFVLTKDWLWRPSPMYDVVPDLGVEHMTSFLGKGRDISRADVLKLGSKYRLSAAKVCEVIDQVQEAVAHYPQLARQYGVKIPSTISFELPK